MALAKKADTIINRIVGSGGEIVYEGVRVQAFVGSVEQQLYSDAIGTPVSVVQTDMNGAYQFWIEEGTYNLRFSVGGIDLGGDDYGIFNPVSGGELEALTERSEAAAEASGTDADRAEAAAEISRDYGAALVRYDYAAANVEVGIPVSQTVQIASSDTGTHTPKAGDYNPDGGNTPNSGLFVKDATLSLVRKAELESTLTAKNAEAAETAAADVAGKVPTFPAKSTYFPVASDDSQKVPLWIENGLVGAVGLTPPLISSVLAQGGIVEAPGLSNQMVPLIQDQVGNVMLWASGGKIDAVGFGPVLSALIGAVDPTKFALRNTATSAVAPSYTDGRSLYDWKAALARVLGGVSAAKAALLLTGDSWTEYPAIPRGFATVLHALYGKAGNGFVGIMSNNSLQRHQNAAITMTAANWTDYDASTGAAVPAFGCALDGNAKSTTGTTATLSLTGWNDTDAKIYYSQQGTGSFRWRIDGGSYTTVTATGGGGLGIVTLSGLGTGTHTLDIDTTVNGGGTVALFGFNTYNSAGTGVLIHKCGNAGAVGANLALFASTYITPMATDLAPNAVIGIASTNDYRFGGNPPSTLIAAYGSLVTSYRAANANCGFIFGAPARSNGTVVTPQSDYRDAIYQFAIANGHEFYNDQDLFGPYAAENTAGMWVDALHKNDVGGLRTAHGVNNSLLRL